MWCGTPPAPSFRAKRSGAKNPLREAKRETESETLGHRPTPASVLGRAELLQSEKRPPFLRSEAADGLLGKRCARCLRRPELGLDDGALTGALRRSTLCRSFPFFFVR